MAKRIDWYYHRTGCATCSRADAYMAQHGLTSGEVVDARKQRLGKREIAAILRGTTKVHAMKGRSTIVFDLKRDPPVEKVLYENLLGPTGNLRAPAVRVGKTLVVGFNEDLWDEILG